MNRLPAGVSLVIAGFAVLVAQFVDPRSARDKEYMAAYTTQPGGVPEENLWQVLILMGTGDKDAADWNGSLQLSGGEIHKLEGYRLEPPDRLLPEGGWQIKTRVERILTGSPLSGHGTGATESLLLPKGLLLRGAGNSSSVAVTTDQGDFTFAPAQLLFGSVEKKVGGRVEVHRIPAATDLSGSELRQHDFPSIASGRDGALWTIWSSYHDRREELNFRRYREGKWTRLIPVARASADLWRPQVATDESDKPWLIWSQQVDGNWDIYAMAWDDNQWGELHRLSDDPMPDIEPHVARSSDGVIYVVWQALPGHHSHVRMKYLKNGRWSQMIHVTDAQLNDWEPAVAVGPDGRVWIAWDRYTTSYDVYCRSYSLSSGLAPEMKVASSNRFEAHASIAVDQQNRPWIAWESGGVNWGKDLGAALGPNAPGHPLGGKRRIEVVCLDNQTWKTPAQFAPADALAIGSTGDYQPLLFVDPSGNIWMAFKRRFSRVAFRPSVFWEAFLSRLENDRWTPATLLPSSSSRNSARMSLSAGNGRLWAFWPTDSRNYAFASRPHSSRVIAGSLIIPAKPPAPQLSVYEPAPAPAPTVHPNEERDVSTIRNHRVRVGDEILRIARGDLHRHTELSQDVGGLDDGSLPEFYRYMIDAAAMDFGASTDHQAGGTDYWNFLTWKMADMYHFPERFSTLFAYERNLGNPHGHRNIVHIERNYPIVPFFQSMNPRFLLPDTPDGEILTFNSNDFGGPMRDDTKLLYEELRKTSGFAIPHTSATASMGTDWADNDPRLDPVAEIYQGARQNYEHKNAPRGIRDGEEAKALGGFQEPGMLWNAWKKGYRLGVIASSDHFSTHISYAMVYTQRTNRKSVFDSILKRRTYGATDNIVLEFWLGDHFMGDDFVSSEKQRVRVKVLGTAPIESIHLIRDGNYIYKVSPGRPNAEFEYLDQDATAGDHWYYVRVEQRNGELAWSSPIWVKYRTL